MRKFVAVTSGRRLQSEHNAGNSVTIHLYYIMTQNNTPQRQGIMSFYRRFPIISTILIMTAVSGVLCAGALIFMDIWTHHGSTSKVPDVKDMSFDQALNVLRDADLDVVVGDSIYDESKPGGTVVDIWPKPGAIVKAGREVYVTIVSFSPRMVVIDMPLTDISLKQAQNYLNNRGINSISVQYVESEFPQMVIAAKVGGEYVTLGSRIPVSSTVTLEVGKEVQPVNIEAEIDSQVDSILSVESTGSEYFE